MTALLLLIVVCTGISYAEIVTYDFDIGWVSRAPDGYIRPVIGINGQWPLPIIEANFGDTIVVNARNSLGNQSTSLHFHGMYQNGSSTSDGGAGSAQCPIYPGGSFTYQFTANPTGTFWYHSHDKGQYPDGLRGKMIIHDLEWEASLKIDQQIFLSLSDWYHTEQPYVIQDYLSLNNTVGDIPSPDSFLFNDTRAAPRFDFQGGKRYLIRIVNMSAVACGMFNIDGHKLTIVGIDGVQIHPKDADTVLICAGQRYDIIVVGNTGFWASSRYIAKMTTDMLTRDLPPERDMSVIGGVVYSAFGRFLDTILGLLVSSWTPPAVLNDFYLQPLRNMPLLQPVDRTINLQTNQTYFEGIGTRISHGPQPWVEPKVPSLYTALSTGCAAMNPSTYGPGVNPWVVRSMEVVQIYMENPQPWPHPMHLHGHEFQVAARGLGSWDGNESALPEVPMMRDTVVMPANGYIVLRFRADNPGVWFFHCHVDLHLVGGMASTIIEAPDLIQAREAIPPQGKCACKMAGKCSSGNCACQEGGISATDAEAQCNTIINMDAMSLGAMVEKAKR